MAELPQSVRKRLSATQAAGAAHPDTDLLAAFTEGALLAGERDRVLAHLAVCADCRSVVALAQPESVSQSVITLERKRSWFEWKVFRVAGALVAVAVVAVAVLMHRPQHSGFDDTSFTKPASAEPQSQRQVPPVLSEQKKAEKTGVPKQEAARKAQGDMPSGSSLDRVENLPKPARPATRADEGKEKDTAQKFKEESAPANFGAMNMSAPAPPPPVLDKSANSAPPPTGNAIGAVLNADNSSLQKKAPAAAAPKSSAQQVTVEAGAEPALVQNQPQEQMVASQVQTAPLAMRQSSQVSLQRALAAQWRITEGGLLQRLIADQDWRTISPGGQSDFRTVASAANHVWVGGVSGLYHSADGGDHWKRVQIGGADSKKDIGEVVSIRIISAEELSVSTASGDVWVTQNGGRTWSHQQK